MTCIFGLSQELFGRKFTKKTKTNKAADKSKNRDNYTTDEAVLKICIKMADWSRRQLADIKPVTDTSLKTHLTPAYLDILLPAKHTPHIVHCRRRAIKKQCSKRCSI